MKDVQNYLPFTTLQGSLNTLLLQWYFDKRNVRVLPLLSHEMNTRIYSSFFNTSERVVIFLTDGLFFFRFTYVCNSNIDVFSPKSTKSLNYYFFLFSCVCLFWYTAKSPSKRRPVLTGFCGCFLLHAPFFLPGVLLVLVALVLVSLLWTTQIFHEWLSIRARTDWIHPKNAINLAAGTLKIRFLLFHVVYSYSCVCAWCAYWRTNCLFFFCAVFIPPFFRFFRFFIFSFFFLFINF